MIKFIIALLRYLFPKRRLKSKLPLLPLQWSSTHGINVDPARALDIAMLKGHGIARTDQDAMRLLEKHSDLKTHELIKKSKRPRRPKQRIARAVNRLKRIW